MPHSPYPPEPRCAGTVRDSGSGYRPARSGRRHALCRPTGPPPARKSNESLAHCKRSTTEEGAQGFAKALSRQRSSVRFRLEGGSWRGKGSGGASGSARGTTWRCTRGTATRPCCKGRTHCSRKCNPNGALRPALPPAAPSRTSSRRPHAPFSAAPAHRLPYRLAPRARNRTRKLPESSVEPWSIRTGRTLTASSTRWASSASSPAPRSSTLGTWATTVSR